MNVEKLNTWHCDLKDPVAVKTFVVMKRFKMRLIALRAVWTNTAATAGKMTS